MHMFEYLLFLPLCFFLGLFNFDEDLDLDPAAEAVDYASFPQSSDDDETSTDGETEQTI